MRKRMRQVIAFIMACCILTVIVWIPIYADEKVESTFGQNTEEDKREQEGKTGEDDVEDTIAEDEAEKGADTNQDQESGTEKKDETTSDDVTKQEEEKKIGEGISDNSTEEQTGEETNEDGTVSGNGTGEDIVSDDDNESEEYESRDKKEETVEIVNVVVPVTYTLALNPYRLPIRTGQGEVITEQVISETYGIVNKSSTDQIVTVSLTVEDGNDGELVFVDSAEEAEKAGMGIYAVYLAVVPANEEQILIGGEPIEETISAESLRNVQMTGAVEQALTLKRGVNDLSFKLSQAVYDSKTEDDFSESEDSLECVLKGLAPDGKGVTAYTFTGVMNPNASWEKLSGGIKLSVVYKYQDADGEEIVEGTGALVSMDEIRSENK